MTTNIVGLTGSAVEDTVGQVTLDGKGNISGTETFSMDGVPASLAVTGTYTESSNCTGTLQITPTGGSAQNFNTVVVNSGRKLLLIETDSNTGTAGNAETAE